MNTLLSTRALGACALAAALLVAPLAFAQSSHGSGHDDGHGSSHGGGHGAAEGIGHAGGHASRTINVSMGDNYYEPETISLAHGETVRFVITNTGSFLHEFNINTGASHEAHAPMMQMMFEMGALEVDRINHAVMNASKGTGHDMSHDEPNSVLIEPGQTREITWTFDTMKDLEFACNIPGHYDSGMVGDFAIAH